MKLKRLLIPAILLLSSLVYAQIEPIDTLSLTKQMVEKKELSEAGKMLKSYCRNHPSNLEAAWRYAMVLHWLKNDRGSEELFNKAVKLAPDNDMLRLDFARMYFSSSKLEKAEPMLLNLKDKPASRAESLLMLAYIKFWQGRYPSAREYLEDLKNSFPGTKAGADLETELEEATSPYIKMGAEHSRDNQPLNSISEYVDFGKSYSWHFSPEIIVDHYNFSEGQQALTLLAGNNFIFGKSAVSLKLMGGLYSNFNDKTDWTADMQLSKNFYKKLKVLAGYNRSAYFGTPSSTFYNLIQNNLFVKIEHSQSKYLDFTLVFNDQFFDDNNPVLTAGGWLLSPQLKAGGFSFQAGYGFSYSNADKNYFTPTKTTEEIIANYDGSNIKGVYDPYFTPKDQVVNAAVLAITYDNSKKIYAALSGSYGFYATHMNPYFYLDINQADEIIIKKDFARTTFHPYNLKASIDFNISRKIKIGALFNIQSTFYYIQHRIGLNMTFVL